MNLDQATKNIDILIQNTRMTRQEHIELDSNFKLLVARAKLADKLEQEKQECDAAKKESVVDPSRPKGGIKEVA